MRMRINNFSVIRHFFVNIINGHFILKCILYSLNALVNYFIKIVPYLIDLLNFLLFVTVYEFHQLSRVVRNFLN